MSVWITEYPALANINGGMSAIPFEVGSAGSGSAAITTTVFSSAQTSTMTLLPTTQIIRIAAQGNCWILCSVSSASTTIATATNCALTLPNIYDYRAVRPGSRLTCLST